VAADTCLRQHSHWGWETILLIKVLYLLFITSEVISVGSYTPLHKSLPGHLAKEHSNYSSVTLLQLEADTCKSILGSLYLTRHTSSKFGLGKGKGKAVPLQA
jgi:hypothetical protein